MGDASMGADAPRGLLRRPPRLQHRDGGAVDEEEASAADKSLSKDRGAEAGSRAGEFEDLSGESVDCFFKTPAEQMGIRRAPDRSGMSAARSKRGAEQSKTKDIFRRMAAYIALHRGKTVVIHVPGEALDKELAHFESLVQDIVLLKTLGVNIVLVTGCRPQINERLCQGGRDPLSMVQENGIYHRTDAFTLRCAREASSSARVYLESQVGRGLGNSAFATGWVQVSSGNFVTADQVGVVNGVDFGYAGRVRKINTDRIRALLNAGDVVIIGCLGYTSSGEVYTCPSEQVAVTAAIQLQAHKLIYLCDDFELYDTVSGGEIHSMPVSVGQAFLAHQTQKHKDSQQAADRDMVHQQSEMLLYMELAIQACAGGVARTHLIGRDDDGSLLLEMFTRDGRGLLVCRDIYDGVRRASPGDVSALMRLIQPLELDGTLVPRSEESVRQGCEAGNFHVVERDGTVIACASLTMYHESLAIEHELEHTQKLAEVSGEIGCIAVDPEARRSGKGNALVGYLLRTAITRGCTSVFALTTRTAHYFIERGFSESTVSCLPTSKRASLDASRLSRVYVMSLAAGVRKLDEQEFMMGL